MEMGQQGLKMKRVAQALVVLVATTCLFTGAISHSTETKTKLPRTVSQRRMLSQETTFDVTITSNAGGSITYSPAPLFTVNFGRAITQKNPLALFTIEGSDRVDVVYSRDGGILYVLAFVDTPDSPTIVTISVQNGVATAVDGAATNRAASLSLNYVPVATGSSTYASIASWGMAGSMALTLGAAAISPSATVGVGAINFAGFVQTFAMSGNLPITNMPANYKAAANNMEWVTLRPKIGPSNPAPTAEQVQQANDLANTVIRFPSTPVAVTLFADTATANSTNISNTSNTNSNGGNSQGSSTPQWPNPFSASDQIVSTTTTSTGNSPDSGNTTTTIITSPTNPQKPVIVVQPLPPGDLATNGTNPTPFINPSPNTGINIGSNTNGAGQSSLSTTTPPVTQLSGEGNQTVAVPSITQGKGNGTASVPPNVLPQGGIDGGVLVPTPGFSASSTNGNPTTNNNTVVVMFGSPPPPTPQKKGRPPSPSGSNYTTGNSKGRAPGPATVSVGPAPVPSNSNNRPVGPSPVKDAANPPAAYQEGADTAIIDIPALAPSTHPDALAPTTASSPSPSPNQQSDTTATNGTAISGTNATRSDAAVVIVNSNSSAAVGAGNPYSVNDDGIIDNDGDDSSPLPATRRLLVTDPVSALSSSGFSYVVVTATANGTADASNSNTSETIGASALSRIRTIQAVGDKPGVNADSTRLETLWDVLFWTAMAILATLVLHGAILGVFKLSKKSVPKMLHLPRLELLVFMMTLPMISAAGSALLQSSSAGIITIGVLFSIIIPFGFLITASAFVIHYLLALTVENRRALYVVVATQSAQSELDAQLFGYRSSSSQQYDGLAGSSSSPTGSLTTAILGPDARDSLAAFSLELGHTDSGVLSDDVPSSSSQATAVEVVSAERATSAIETAPPVGEFVAPLQQTSSINTTTGSDQRRFIFKKLKHAVFAWVLKPIFGFSDDPNPSADGAAWLGRGKWDAQFVKRYGCFFEDTHGPPVLRVRSRFDPSATEDVVGTGVLIPANPTGMADGALQALQTFGVIFAVTKMVLFAVIINAPGGFNNAAQVVALAIIALMHVIYLRLCTPYRLKVELVAEIIASTCDLAVFVCGIVLIAKKNWTSDQRHSMGVAMLSLQAIGFLIFITIRVVLALRTLIKTVGPALKEWIRPNKSAGKQARVLPQQFMSSSR